MNTPRARSLRIPAVAWYAIVALALLGLIYWKAEQNYIHNDYVNSNFFSFWLSGHMAWNGQSPYDPAQWLAGFDAAGATYRPSRILQYPLPLMYFMAPVGLLPVGQAYFAWQVICQLIIVLCVFLLLRQARAPAWLVLPIFAFLLFFGPVYLSLQVGSVGAIALLAVTLGILLLETGQPLFAGLALSLLVLKPSQALTLLALAGIWFLARRNWRAIGGLVIGGLVLLLVWLVRDPLGISKFRGSSDFLLGRTLGVQSNVFSFAYLTCGHSTSCMWVAGAIAAVLVLALGAAILWRHRTTWTDWQAFNLIIPLGFLTAVYLWAYDQLLYIVPIVWLASRLLPRRRAYILFPLLFVLFDIVAFIALGVQANTKQDLLSIATTLLVLGLLWLLRTPSRVSPSPLDFPP